MAYTWTRDARRPLSCAVTNPSRTISGADGDRTPPPSCSRKNPRRHDDMVGLAEPLQDQIAKARPHRHSDHQRPGKHRDGDGDSADDGQVGPPVMAKASTSRVAGRIAGQADALQRAIDEVESDRETCGELGAVGDHDRAWRSASAAARAAATRPHRPTADRDCRSARRTAAAAGGGPARARARRAAFRLRTAGPARWLMRCVSPT